MVALLGGGCSIIDGLNVPSDPVVRVEPVDSGVPHDAGLIASVDAGLPDTGVIDADAGVADVGDAEPQDTGPACAPFARIFAGWQFNLAIRTDGTLWSWGRNDHGQLGVGDASERGQPVQVGRESGWRSAAGGQSHALAIRDDGTLWVWGHNVDGQLGAADLLMISRRPAQLGVRTDWQAVAAGIRTSYALDDSGTLWAWGKNGARQLGTGSVADSEWAMAPVVAGPFVAVTTRERHALAIDTHDRLWCWGRNRRGQCGRPGDPVSTPTTTPGLGKVRDLAAGAGHSLVITEDGRLYSFGDNAVGQLGLGRFNNGANRTPAQVGLQDDWTAVRAGGGFSLAIKRDGSLWSWDFNNRGQLGLDDTVNRDSPQPVTSSTAVGWRSVTGGWRHAIGIRADGTTWTWGLDANGQLGLPEPGQRDAPVLLDPCL